MSIQRETVEQRKALPLATGVLDYFPDALLAVAEVSRVGNEQHHPGEPLHWDKSKSTDEADALLRHLLDRGTRDTDGMRHSAKVAWRALAMLQRELDAEAAAAGQPPCGGDEQCDGTCRIAAEPAFIDPGDPLYVSGFDVATGSDVTITYRGEWPVDTRDANGLLTCCGQTQHSIICPQWR